MTKEEVEDKHLVDYVLPFAAWWKTVDKDEVVEVQYPHDRHGLAGKLSNHTKQDVMVQFLKFVDKTHSPMVVRRVATVLDSSFSHSSPGLLPLQRERILRKGAGHLLWQCLTGFTLFTPLRAGNVTPPTDRIAT